MELTQLRYFVAAANSRTLTEAARTVYVSQPAMSAAIRKLEEELGILLLERRRGRGQLRLTSAGSRVLERARRVLTEADRLKSDVRSWERLEGGIVHIGAGTAALEYFLPDTVATMRRAYPGLQIVLHEVRTSLVIRMLNDGEIDVGVVTAPISDEIPVIIPWVEDPLVLCAAVDLRDEVSAPMTAREAFARFRLISYGPGELQEQIELTLASCGVRRRGERLIIRSGEAMKAYVEAGLGVGFLSRRSAAAALEAGRLCAVNLSDLKITRQYAIIHREHSISAVNAFVDVATRGERRPGVESP
jgi:LysR family hydrogen peroxide-inducible transcriptional activator